MSFFRKTCPFLALLWAEAKQNVAIAQRHEDNVQQKRYHVEAHHLGVRALPAWERWVSGEVGLAAVIRTLALQEH